MPGDHIQRERRLAISVIICLVNRNNDIFLSAYNFWCHVSKEIPNFDSSIAHQPIDLFNRMLGLKTLSLSQSKANS